MVDSQSLRNTKSLYFNKKKETTNMIGAKQRRQTASSSPRHWDQIHTSFKCSRGPIQIIRPNRAIVKEQIEMSKFSVQSLVGLKV